MSKMVTMGGSPVNGSIPMGKPQDVASMAKLPAPGLTPMSAACSATGK